MKLNQKDAMQTEDKESITQCKITFQKKTKNSSFAVAVSPVQIMTSSTILQNSACLSFRQIQQTNIHYTSLQSVRSATQWDFAYRSSLVSDYIENIFQHSAPLCNDTLLYSKPAYHHSCWFTQRCQMFQAQEKPSETFAMKK